MARVSAAVARGLMRRGSAAERDLAAQVRYARLPEPEREYRFLPARMFRFDFAWPAQRVAFEVEGIVYRGKSRHTTPAGYSTDIEKYNLAALAGWRVLRGTQEHVRSGQALEWLILALGRTA